MYDELSLILITIFSSKLYLQTDIGECSDNEKEMFPLRMKQWLNEVLLILVC